MPPVIRSVRALRRARARTPRRPNVSRDVRRRIWHRIAWPGRPRPARPATPHLRRWRPALVATVAAVATAGTSMVAPAADGATAAPARSDRAPLVGQAPTALGEPTPAVAYTPPVDAAITDPFRPPAGPYGSGNRGLDYDTSPGVPVRASAPGTVVFAGPVAGSLHVTIRHADGVRTSYSFLQTVVAVVGARVSTGDVVGTAGEHLHFGARVADAYVDPAVLFSVATAVELLPLEVPPGSTPHDEARALLEVAIHEGDGHPAAALGPALRWLRRRVGDGFEVLGPLTGPAGFVGFRRGLDVAGELTDRLLFPPPCSEGAPPIRPAASSGGSPRPAGGSRPRVAVTVAGLGSTSDSAAIDDLRASELGYDEGRVVRFSYRGGRTPDPAVAIEGPAARPYTSADTQGDAHVAGDRLADLVEAVAVAEPGAPIDVYAHSLGGLVARLALAELDRRGFDLDRIGVVVTLASPHGGADLATAVSSTSGAPRAGPALDVAADVLDLGLDPDAPVVAQLSEGSPLVRELAGAGVPDGVRLLSIGARGDLIVPSPRTRVAGATHVTVPTAGVGAHGEVVGSDAATAEIARALAGRPPGCEAWHDVVADVLTGHAISAVEDDLGLALLAAG